MKKLKYTRPDTDDKKVTVKFGGNQIHELSLPKATKIDYWPNQQTLELKLKKQVIAVYYNVQAFHVDMDSK